MSLLKLAQLQTIEVKLKRHKLVWNTVQDFANSGVIRGANGGMQSWAQTLRAHQYTLLCSHLKTCFKVDI